MLPSTMTTTIAGGFVIRLTPSILTILLDLPVRVTQVNDVHLGQEMQEVATFLFVEDATQLTIGLDVGDVHRLRPGLIDDPSPGQ